MKTLRFVLAGLLIIACAVVVTAHLKRNALARNLVNDWLAGTDFNVESLSISRLRPGEIRFGRLVLRQTDGARYEMRDLRVPMRLPGLEVHQIWMRSLQVQPAATSEPLPVAALLGTFLSLPERFPEMEVEVEQLQWPDWPVIDTARWQTRSQLQTLSLHCLGLELSATSRSTDTGAYRLSLAAQEPHAPAALSARLQAVPESSGWRLEGEVQTDAAALLTAARPLFAIPALPVEVGGAANARLRIELEVAARGDYRVELAADPTDDLRLAYKDTQGAELALRNLAPATMGYHHPAGDWHLETSSLEFAVTHPSMRAATGQVTALSCQPGLCVLDAKGRLDGLHAQDTQVRTTEFQLHSRFERGDEWKAQLTPTLLRLQGVRGGTTWQVDEIILGSRGQSIECSPRQCSLTLTGKARRLHMAELAAAAADVGIRATFHPGADWRLSARPSLVRLSELRGQDWQLAELALAAASSLAITASPGRLKATAASAALELHELGSTAGLGGSARLRLEDFSADLASRRFAGRFELPASGQKLAWRDQAIVPVLASGQFDYRNDRGSVRGTLSDPARGLEARLQAQSAPGLINVQLESASLDFNKAPLSRLLSRWTYPFDLVAGRAQASGTVSLRDGQGGANGNLEIGIEDAAGTWNELGATGIRARLPVRIQAGKSPVIGPATLSASLLDIGLAISSPTAEFTLDTSGTVVEVNRLSGGVLGGSLRAAPFRFDLESATAKMILSAQDIQLKLIPELAGLKSLEISGTLSGTIPVSIDGKAITVDGGHLASAAPGGVIRYRGTAPAEGRSNLALVQRALSNLEYESLTSDVSYGKSGDLLLKMRLKGTNPDLDPLQPVILNLSIQNNMVDLLKSLQASRNIEEVIERRTTRGRGPLPQ